MSDSRLERLLLWDLRRLVQRKMSSGRWRWWGLAKREPEHALSNGRSQNHYLLALACRSVVAVNSGNRAEIRACARFWGRVELHYAKFGHCGPEMAGQYDRWNILAFVVAFEFLSRTENVAPLRSLIRRSMVLWALTSDAGFVMRNDDWPGTAGRMLYSGPGGIRKGFRQLPWSWTGTVAEPIYASLWGFQGIDRGVFRSLARAIEWDIFNLLSIKPQNYRSPSEHEAVSRALNGRSVEGVADMAVDLGLRCFHAYEILWSKDRILTCVQRRSPGSTTAAPEAFVFERRTPVSRAMWRHGKLRRVRNVSGAVVNGWPVSESDWDEARRSGIALHVDGHAEGESVAPRIAFPLIGDVTRITLFPNHAPHVSRVN